MNCRSAALLHNSRFRRETPSRLAFERLGSVPGEPLFIADWERALMIHYEVEPHVLQSQVPFKLDLMEGRAFISAVAFTMRGMRPRLGGKIAGWLLKPISTHEFLNVRTYVRHRNEPGIYFLAEWLSNRMSTLLGPGLFGLPYRYAELNYNHCCETGVLKGKVLVRDHSIGFEYHASIASRTEAAFMQCEEGSLEEWLMERYTAFTKLHGSALFFRVWHTPWMQTAARIRITDQSLLNEHWPFLKEAQLTGANFCASLRDVWMGWPHRLR